MTKPVRIAMLGAGFVADFYMQGLKDVPGQETVLVYSRTLRSARKLARKWNIPEVTNKREEAIKRKDIDLYLIALPNFLHKEVALQLADEKRNMVCTKPLARTKEEARAMLEAVSAAGVMHGYAETEVFAPAVVKARAIIETGGIGKVHWVRSREAHGGPHAGWFWDPALSGGGALMDMGCHCVEAARYFFGKKDVIVEVLGWGDTLYHDTQGEDNALLVMRFKSGGIAQAEVSWTARGGLDLRNEIFGSEGAIFTDVTRQAPIRAFTTSQAGYIVEKADAERGWVIPVPEEAYTYGYQAEMKHFVECVRRGEEPRETFQDGYIVNCIIEAGYRSMKTGSWESVEY